MIWLRGGGLLVLSPIVIIDGRLCMFNCTVGLFRRLLQLAVAVLLMYHALSFL